MKDIEFEQVAELAANPGDGPFLLELARRIDAGVPRARVFRWTGGSLIASVAEDRDRVRVRDADEADAELLFTLDDLRGLAAICEDWSRIRSAWFEFGFRRHWTDSGRFAFLIEPGGHGEPVQFGGRWRGDDRRVDGNLPQMLAAGAARVADIMRIGEAVGPPDGSPVGSVYQLGDLLATAHRSRLEIARGSARLTIGPADAGLPGELVRVVEVGA
jgi:hypothetical protein